jgi:hypothetical protein
LTVLRPIRSTSRSCRSAWRHSHPGRRSTYRRGTFVQRVGATADRL